MLSSVYVSVLNYVALFWSKIGGAKKSGISPANRGKFPSKHSQPTTNTKNIGITNYFLRINKDERTYSFQQLNCFITGCATLVQYRSGKKEGRKIKEEEWLRCNHPPSLLLFSLSYRCRCSSVILNTCVPKPKRVALLSSAQRIFLQIGTPIQNFHIQRMDYLSLSD